MTDGWDGRSYSWILFWVLTDERTDGRTKRHLFIKQFQNNTFVGIWKVSGSKWNILWDTL